MNRIWKLSDRSLIVIVLTVAVLWSALVWTGGVATGRALFSPHASAAVTNPPPPLLPRTVLDVNGQGTKQTQTFAAGPRWSIDWQADNAGDFSGHFSIEIYDAVTHQLAGLVGNVVVPPRAGLTDTNAEHRASRYYLAIEGTNVNWHVVVTA